MRGNRKTVKNILRQEFYILHVRSIGCDLLHFGMYVKVWSKFTTREQKKHLWKLFIRWGCTGSIGIWRQLNSLLSAAFFIPDSSSGKSGLRPMRSNLDTCKDQCKEKSIDTMAALSMEIWEPFVVSSKTMASSVRLRGSVFHQELTTRASTSSC